MNRFFADPGSIGENTITISNKDDIKHITKVLRMREGDELEVSDGEKWEYVAVIKYKDTDTLELTITDKQKHSAEPSVRVTLFQGIPKQNKMDDIVRKCTELGIAGIVPVFMKRTIVSKKTGFKKKSERMKQIAKSAAEQCKRGVIPRIYDALDGSDMPDKLAGFDHVIFPYENEEDITIKDALRGLCSAKDAHCFADGAKKEKKNEEVAGVTEPGEDGYLAKTARGMNIAIVIGPEGGFSNEEANALKELGNVSCVSLGKTILRTETAGMAALAMVMYELEM